MVRRHRDKFYRYGLMVWALLLIPGVTEGAHHPKRIISLAPNVTETLYALGMGPRIIAVSRQCDYPNAVRVKQRVGDMVNPSLEAIVSLTPDLVILTDDGNPRLIWERLRELQIPTHVFRPRRLQDLAPEIRRLGAVLEIPHEADRLARNIERELTHYGGIQNKGKKRTALFLIQMNPLIAAGPGTVIDDIFRLLALQNVAAQARVSYPTYSREDLMNFNPDVIFAGHGISLDAIRSWKELAAVRHGYLFEISDTIFRMGPRITQGIREMAAIIGSLP